MFQFSTVEIYVSNIKKIDFLLRAGSSEFLSK